MLFAVIPLFFIVTSALKCEYGWDYNIQTHSCYHIAYHPRSWNDAESYCQDEESHLVSITSDQERLFVEGLIDDEFLSWVGLRRPDNESEFSWCDGSELTYTFFTHGQLEERGDCIAWSTTGRQRGWKAISCDYSQFFVCKKRAQRSAPQIITNSQGVLTSRGYPFAYDEKEFQAALIETIPNSKVIIRLEDLDIGVEKDFLTIYDGSTLKSPILTKLSGQADIATYVSSSNKTLILFTSNSEYHGRGFKIEYDTMLNHELIHLKNISDVLRSPNFPENFPMFMKQDYLITCDPEYHVHFNLTSLDLSHNDQLLFFNGAFADIDAINKFPNSYSHIPFLFRSSSENVLIRFESNENITRHTGYQLIYHCVRLDGMGEEIII